MEIKLLAAALKSRSAYETIRSMGSESLTDRGKIIFEEIGKFYEKDHKVESADRTIVANSLARKHPKFEEVFRTAVENLPEDVSPTNIVSDIIEVKVDRISQELAQAFAQGQGERIAELLPEWQRLRDGFIEEEEEGSTIRQGVTLVEMMKDSTKEKIKIAPPALNKHLDGGASRTEHIVIFGRPEIAKTTFLLNMLYGFVCQGLKVLYMNNEDPELKLITRFYQRATGMSKHDIEANPDVADQKMQEKGVYDNAVFFCVPDGTLEDVEKLIQSHQPDVVMIDQIRNISCKGDNRVLQLEYIARSLRKMAKRYNLLMISVTQAGGSADNKKVLEMGDIDWNNTGIQGAADLMIGIGADERMKDSGQRILSFPKNKISARHDPIQVTFDTIRVRVK